MLNKFETIGRLTKEIELKKAKNNASVITFTLAVDDGKDREGNKKTQFTNFIAWEGRAETLAKYLKKGDLVFVESKFENNNYETNGVKVYSYVFNVTGFNLLPNNRKEETKYEEENSTGHYEIKNDDLPFY